jgi:hypothetical protein
MLVVKFIVLLLLLFGELELIRSQKVCSGSDTKIDCESTTCCAGGRGDKCQWSAMSTNQKKRNLQQSNHTLLQNDGNDLIKREIGVCICKLGGACCPVDCEVVWTQWSSCSRTCGPGTRSRTFVSTTGPSCGGKTCEAVESPQSIECNIGPCPLPQDCMVTGWSAWSTCSVDCGTGVETRTRAVAVVEEPGGQCKDALWEERSCHVDSGGTPADCVIGFWSQWSFCASACSGTKVRTRHIDAATCGGSCATNVTSEEATCVTGTCGCSLFTTCADCMAGTSCHFCLKTNGSGVCRNSGTCQTDTMVQTTCAPIPTTTTTTITTSTTATTTTTTTTAPSSTTTISDTTQSQSTTTTNQDSLQSDSTTTILPSTSSTASETTISVSETSSTSTTMTTISSTINDAIDQELETGLDIAFIAGIAGAAGFLLLVLIIVGIVVALRRRNKNNATTTATATLSSTDMHTFSAANDEFASARESFPKRTNEYGSAPPMMNSQYDVAPPEVNTSI